MELSFEDSILVDEAKGERLRREANEWIANNPKAWDYMIEAARISASLKHRFSIGSLCEHVRWKMIVNGTHEFKLNNNHRAWFARRLIQEVPECEPYIKTRASVTDMGGADDYC